MPDSPFPHAPMKILLTQQQLDSGVRRMADQVTECYGQQPVTILGVMTGSLLLLADLIRQLSMPLRVGIVQASSYRRGPEPAELLVRDSWMPEIAGRHVLVVDDIFDTGHTLCEVLRRMRHLEPASVRTVVLLRKAGRQQVDLQPDFVGFEIPDRFVVGYGLDYRGRYRNLPYVAELEPDDLRADHES